MVLGLVVAIVGASWNDVVGLGAKIAYKGPKSNPRPTPEGCRLPMEGPRPPLESPRLILREPRRLSRGPERHAREPKKWLGTTLSVPRWVLSCLHRIENFEIMFRDLIFEFKVPGHRVLESSMTSISIYCTTSSKTGSINFL
jgi:hypothetical protein